NWALRPAESAMSFKYRFQSVARSRWFARALGTFQSYPGFGETLSGNFCAVVAPAGDRRERIKFRSSTVVGRPYGALAPAPKIRHVGSSTMIARHSADYAFA